MTTTIQKPILLDGKTLAQKIKEELKKKLALHKIQSKSLATILVGDDTASHTYVKMKIRACEMIGLGSRLISLSKDISTEALLKEIDILNQDSEIAGILLQHPVPAQIDERLAFDKIQISKDVDGVTSMGFGKISLGMQDVFAPCTPLGILRLLMHYNIPLEAKHIVVVGRSAILGRPLAMLALLHNATVTICHSYTKNIASHLKEADIVVGACGRPKLIKGEYLKDGVVVIDAGYNEGNVGDVDYESCLSKASYITPVPGGVGPMTIAMLLENTVKAAIKGVG